MSFKAVANKYWGKAGSGILYICLDDMTAMLLLRSADVEQPYTWGNPGGAVSGTEGFYSPEECDEDCEDRYRPSAEKETVEEIGFLPVGEDLGSTVYKDGNFTYVTYIVSVSKAEKERINSSYNLNYENTDLSWHSLSDMPDKLHFGIKYVLDNLDIDKMNIKKNASGMKIRGIERTVEFDSGSYYIFA